MLGTANKTLSALIFSKLEKFGRKIGEFGVNFAVCNTNGELILMYEAGRFQSSRKQLTEIAQQALDYDRRSNSDENIEIPVWRFGDTNLVLVVVLRAQTTGVDKGESIGTALIDFGDKSPCLLHDGKFGQCGADADSLADRYLMEMLRLLVNNLQANLEAEGQIEMVSTELARVYEELVLLHRLGTNMKVTESDTNFLQMACDCLTEAVSVEGIAVLLEKNIEGEKRFTVTAGSGLIDMDDRMAAILYSRLSEEIDNGKEALLDSEVDSPFRYEWPSNVKNIIAVPLYGKDTHDSHLSQRTKSSNPIVGFMLAINRIDKPDFDSTDVKLFNSVASSCAVFVENGRLFNDLKELFIGSLKALTRSIDAKDAYTRGHSERVAFISRWIAERLLAQEPYKAEQIHKIYLAGLLHDIGKIGIEETVLCKAGPLTEQERDRIRKHPSIGAGILRGIKQMRDIVPGVLCHHERADGKGYPNGLTVDEIPLTGKIVGLADSFDAMTSKRTYRDAKTVEQAIEEVEKNLGTQFDEKIGRIFLDSDVYRLWEIMQDSFSGVYGTDEFCEYGADAVGTLIR